MGKQWKKQKLRRTYVVSKYTKSNSLDFNVTQKLLFSNSRGSAEFGVLGRQLRDPELRRESNKRSTRKLFGHLMTHPDVANCTVVRYCSACWVDEFSIIYCETYQLHLNMDTEDTKPLYIWVAHNYYHNAEKRLKNNVSEPIIDLFHDCFFKMKNRHIEFGNGCTVKLDLYNRRRALQSRFVLSKTFMSN